MTTAYLNTTGLTFPDFTTQTTAVPDPGNVGNVLTSIGNRWASQVSSTKSYDVVVWYSGSPTADLVLLQYPVTQQVLFQADFAGSLAAPPTVGASVDAVFSINKNGFNIGIMTYIGGSNVVDFSTDGNTVTFVAGDILSIVAPSVQDATLAGISVDLKGTQI